jgi:dihydrofolate reductase
MEGGTTFHFVTDGHESALKQAQAAAKGKDVRIGGGVSTVRQYVMDGLVDELQVSFSPVLLGEGENLFSGIDFAKLGYAPTKTIRGENATHVVITRT